MNKIAALLAAIGVTLVGVAGWLYNQADADGLAAESICRLGGSVCDASINWLPIVAVGVAGVAAVVAAWKMSRSVENESAQDLVG